MESTFGSVASEESELFPCDEPDVLQQHHERCLARRRKEAADKGRFYDAENDDPETSIPDPGKYLGMFVADHRRDAEESVAKELARSQHFVEFNA